MLVRDSIPSQAATARAELQRSNEIMSNALKRKWSSFPQVRNTPAETPQTNGNTRTVRAELCRVQLWSSYLWSRSAALPIHPAIVASMQVSPQWQVEYLPMVSPAAMVSLIWRMQICASHSNEGLSLAISMDSTVDLRFRSGRSAGCTGYRVAPEGSTSRRSVPTRRSALIRPGCLR